MKNRFNAGTDWRESSHSAPTTPVSSKKITKWGPNPGKKQTDASGTGISSLLEYNNDNLAIGILIK